MKIQKKRIPSITSTFLFSSIILPMTAFAQSAVTTTAPTASLPSTATMPSIFNTLFGLGVVIAIIFGLAWIVKRLGWQKRFGTRSIKVLGSATLGARERVILIEAENQRFLLGVGPGNVRHIATLTGQENSEVHKTKMNETPSSNTSFEAAKHHSYSEKDDYQLQRDAKHFSKILSETKKNKS